MTYRFRSAQYANPDNTSAIAITQEAGAVLVTRDDMPELWAAMLKAASPSPYASPLPMVPRKTAMWRARTIMKMTPHGDGILFNAVTAAIAVLPDSAQKAAAEEALERGDLFDMDGVFVPMLAFAVGIDEPQILDLIAQAEALPA